MAQGHVSRVQSPTLWRWQLFLTCWRFAHSAADRKYPSHEWRDAVVLNNHFDTDGLMSAWALLEPEKALQHESAMVMAAAAGKRFQGQGVG